MKFQNIRTIFINDWRRVLHNPVGIIITIGICILPALYAWVNIKACWDVYENTGSIPVAVVNNDQAARLNDKEINIGESVIEQLKENKKIDWKFVSQRQADLGLADGTYFAEIELPKDFSENFTTLLSDTPVKPKIIYKVDTKVNPVAEKITETAKNTLVQEIKSNFISTVNESIFSTLNPVGDDADANLQDVIQMKDAIVTLSRNMDTVSDSVDHLHTSADNMNTFLSSVNAAWPLVESGLQSGSQTAVNQQALSRATQQRLNSSLTNLDTNLSYTKSSGERAHALLSELNAAAKTGSTAETDKVFTDLDAALSAMEDSTAATSNYLEQYSDIDWGADAKSTADRLSTLQTQLKQLRTSLVGMRQNLKQLGTNTDAFYNSLDQTISVLKGQIADIDQTLDTLIAQLEALESLYPSQQLETMIADLKAMRDSGAGASLLKTVNEIAATKSTTDAALKSADEAAATLIATIDDTVPKIDKTIEFLQTVQDNESNKEKQLKKMIHSLDSTEGEITNLRTKLSELQKQSNLAEEIAAGKADTINNDLSQTQQQLNSIFTDYNKSIRGDVATIGTNLVKSADGAAQLAQSAQSLGTEIGAMLKTTQSGAELTADLTGTLAEKLLEFRDTIQTLGGKLELVNNNDIVQIISILQSNPEFMGDYVSSPFEQKTESINAIPNYGSSMTPIYTSLALWVGCLILNSILRSRPFMKKEDEEKFTLREKHFGKMMTFCSIAAMQGLITAIGNLALLKIHVVNGFLFLFVAVFSSLVFCIITYTLYSTLGNAGKALAIIYMIFQLAGSGGSYPIQVDPPIFRVLQPLFPFTYALSGFREAIAGPLTSQVLLDFAVLTLFALVFLIAGYFLVQRLNEPVRHFEENFKRSGLSE